MKLNWRRWPLLGLTSVATAFPLACGAPSYRVAAPPAAPRHDLPTVAVAAPKEAERRPDVDAKRITESSLGADTAKAMDPGPGSTAFGPSKKTKPKAYEFAGDDVAGSLAPAAPAPPPPSPAAAADSDRTEALERAPAISASKSSGGVLKGLGKLFRGGRGGGGGAKGKKAAPAAKAEALEPADEEADDEDGVSTGSGTGKDKADEAERSVTGGASTEPLEARLRKDFPEALFFAPEVVTSDAGAATVKVPLADTVTDWRVTALASSADGRFGDGEGKLHVFQPFFVNVHAPRELQSGDTVTVQVGVFNYLETASRVKIEVTRAPWFEALSPLTGEIDVSAGSAAAFPVTIKVLRDGKWGMRVDARTADHADAVEAPFVVGVGGVPFTAGGITDVLGEATFALAIPASALPAGRSVALRVYGGVSATLQADLEAFVAMPTGCLEQTLSRMDANLAALAYLEAVGKADSPLAKLARGYLRDGYFKLLTHRASGAFALYPGKPTGDDYEGYLGVRALELLREAATHKGVTIDGDLVAALESWAKARYMPVLAAPAVTYWDDDGRPVAGPSFDLPLLAAVARALRVPLAPAARARLVAALPAANAYGAAMVASYARRVGDAELWTLAADRVLALGDGSKGWTLGGGRSLAASYGPYADIEATGLAATELLRGAAAKGTDAPAGAAPGGRYAEAGARAMSWLLTTRGASGGWGVTSSSARAVEAGAAFAAVSGKTKGGAVAVFKGGTLLGRVDVPADGEVSALDLTGKLAPGEAVKVVAPGGARVELASVWRVAYEAAVAAAPAAYTLKVAYSDVELKAGELVAVRVSAVRTSGAYGVNPAVIRIPIAGTLSVDERGLEHLVKIEAIDRFDRDATGLTLYVDDVDAAGVALAFNVRALFPGEATTGVPEVYEYYHPAARGLAAPTTIRTLSDVPAPR